MIKKQKIAVKKESRGLRDFIRLVLAFFACLAVFSVYQNVILYQDGVLDSVFNKSLWLQMVNHAGFTASIGLFLSFFFNFLERRRPGVGFLAIQWVFILLLVFEGLLIRYFTKNFEPLDVGLTDGLDTDPIWFGGAIIVLVSLPMFKIFYKLMAWVYGGISKMYPFTIILFSFFLASLMAEKRPVNENKSQHFLESALTLLLDAEPYSGDVEFPLLRAYDPDQSLVPFFDLSKELPNIVVIVIDGLGSDFLGKGSKYHGFAPYLDSMASKSLYWPNFLSNTGTSKAALASVTGSLPFGRDGFTNLDSYVNRQTLFSILQKNGYTTSFHYGGNTAIDHWDRFLSEEMVDFVFDDKSFGTKYQKQPADAAGNSPGYPDKALFARYAAGLAGAHAPRLEFFYTLSSRAPFNIPQAEAYGQKVLQVISQKEWQGQQARLVRKNKEKFASIMYADNAIKHFMKSYSLLPDYRNTIFVISGSHNMTELPHESPLDRYRVPLLIYSPMLKAPTSINTLASHADILPSVLGLLQQSYTMEIPDYIAWLGSGLVKQGQSGRKECIPLLRHNNKIQEIIKGGYALSDGELYHLDENLRLIEYEQGSLEEEMETLLAYFKSVNNYVTRYNKLLPPSQALSAKEGIAPDKQQLVWIQSVFNGSNYDNAYATARRLALEGNTDRALLLCRHILNNVPGHADTEILMGRILGWQNEYEKAAEVLQAVIRKYPVYVDGYAALLDVYYWSGDFEEALKLEEVILKNHVKNPELETKLDRAFQQKIRFDGNDLKNATQAQASISLKPGQ